MARCLSDFSGSWRLTRRVRNAIGPDAVFRGTAEFIETDAGLDLIEQGEMQLDGQGSFQASQTYRWCSEDASIVVFFADGRDFHHFDPALDRAEAQHFCKPDTYQVAYDFTDWPLWRAEWRVHGPRKSYVMQSSYSRLSAGTCTA